MLQDLSADTLEVRRHLKPLTSLLMKNMIRYRWQMYTKVQVIFKGVPLMAEDFGSASQMLQHLGIEVPEDFHELEPSTACESWQKI